MIISGKKRLENFSAKFNVNLLRGLSNWKYHKIDINLVDE